MSAETATTGGFAFRELALDGRAYPYVLFQPREGAGAAVRPERGWPLIVFLHGRGESGTNVERVLINGLPQSIMRFPERWPSIVLMPQKPEQTVHWDEHHAAVMAMIDRTMREHAIDADRVYLTGLSQGGRGTWLIGAKEPERFAALVSVCGFADPENVAEKIKSLPIWAFHGDADDVISVNHTLNMVEALKAAGASRVRMTIYPGVNHNSWTRAYEEPELATWLLEQRRGQ